MTTPDINTVIVPIGISLFISSIYGVLMCIRNNRRLRNLDAQIEYLSSKVNNLQVQFVPTATATASQLPMYGGYPQAAYAVPLPYPAHNTVTI
jgi:hypothetical protein